MEKLDQVKLETLLREAEKAHAEYEETLASKDSDWPKWYANYILNRLDSDK